MKAMRMMYIIGVYLLTWPLLLIFSIGVCIWEIIDWKLTFDEWDFDAIGGLFEGIKAGLQFNWHWAKTGESDYTILM